ncbi:MAG: cysteine desulfurase family protein [Patescibacteria group bacterium]
MREIYLDHAAAAPVDPAVTREVIRGIKIVGNPSSFNDAGRNAAKELLVARQKVARFLNARPDEIVFTASGSESNSLAVFGSVNASGVARGEIVSQPTEHLSVLEPIGRLNRLGYKVKMASVDRDGIVSTADVVKLITSKTILVSVMYANNEIGTIQPIAEIGKAIRDFRKKSGSIYPLFHIDACQAAPFLSVDVQNLNVDLLTFNGSKIYGPRGIGILYVRRGVALEPLILGGSQERGRRAGTENLPTILGLAKVVSLINPKRDNKKISTLRDYFFSQLTKILPEARINGAMGDKRLANNVNISIPYADSERLLLELDKYGIRAGSGSACTAHSVEPSHVLKAIGVKPPYLDGALRFSLGRRTKKEDMGNLLRKLSQIIKLLKKRYPKSDFIE